MAYMLELGCVFHSLFIGLSLGVTIEGRPQVRIPKVLSLKAILVPSTEVCRSQPEGLRGSSLQTLWFIGACVPSNPVSCADYLDCKLDQNQTVLLLMHHFLCADCRIILLSLQVLALIVALAVHQLLEGLALGSVVAAADFGRYNGGCGQECGLGRVWGGEASV